MKRIAARKSSSKQRDASPVDRVIAAADAFRRGRPVIIREGRTALLAYAVETLPSAALKTLRKAAKMPPHLVLTHARARTLKIRLYTPDVVALTVAADSDVQKLIAIADPTDDLLYPMKGPFDAVREKLPAGYAAGVKLAKLSGLLPAIVVQRAPRDATGVAITASDIVAYDDEIVRTLRIVTRARVPLAGAEKTELVGFRPADGGPEHFAIVIGAPPTAKPVLTRLHSECFTGDLLGSLKCDCGDQLRGAIDAIEKAGGGVLLYLAQEGRGIGLINKLRAYRLQDQGFDTIDANERLGFASDERQYGIAARMLELLGYSKVRLMTNNPDKIAGLKAAGVKVVARMQHSFPDNKHNHDYLRTKAEKAGHLL
jgi:GTP cyclohydrolase II